MHVLKVPITRSLPVFSISAFVAGLGATSLSPVNRSPSSVAGAMFCGARAIGIGCGRRYTIDSAAHTATGLPRTMNGLNVHDAVAAITVLPYDVHAGGAPGDAMISACFTLPRGSMHTAIAAGTWSLPG